MNEHYHFYYIKDLLGNVRETYVHPEAGYKECIQRMQYYPSGLPWLEAYSPSEQPWKYNSRGSEACITIHPNDADAFFSHFTWINDKKTTGNSQGRIFISRDKETKGKKR